MKKAAAALAGITLALAPWGGAAANESPVRFAPGGVGNAHPHHVHTGNGGCVNINSVFFVQTDHGLHQGATESGSETGPWHGPCH